MPNPGQALDIPRKPAAGFIKKVEYFKHYAKGGKVFKTIPTRDGSKGSGKVRVTQVAHIWYGAVALARPAKYGALLFDWLGWKWDKARQGHPSGGGDDVLAMDKEKSSKTLQAGSFRGFSKAAIDAPLPKRKE